MNVTAGGGPRPRELVAAKAIDGLALARTPLQDADIARLPRRARPGQATRRRDRTRQRASPGVVRGAATRCTTAPTGGVAEADRLSEIADEETVDAVVTADTMQGRPATPSPGAPPTRASYAAPDER